MPLPSEFLSPGQVLVSKSIEAVQPRLSRGRLLRAQLMASDSSAVQRQIDALGGSTGVALSDPQVISDALLTDLVERDGGRHRCVE